MREARRYAIAVCAAFLLIAYGVAFVGFAAGKPQAAGYHLVKKVVLGGDGGWDYFQADPETHRIFIPRRTHTMVVDVDGKVVGDMPIMGSHAVAFIPELKRGFTSNGDAHSVTIFDMGTLRVIRTIDLPDQHPDGILYDTSSKHVFAFDNNGKVVVFDPKSGEMTGTIDLGGKPETAQADGAGHIYVNIENKNQILAFDSVTLKVLGNWPIDPCNEPAGLAIDVAHKRLFAGCHNKMMTVVDYTNGKVVATIPIGTGVDAGRFDPVTGLAFASCGDGTITVVHEDSPDKYSVVQTISTQQGARTMTIDTKNHNVYTVTAENGPLPAATADNPRPRATTLPNSFTLLIFSR